MTLQINVQGGTGAGCKIGPKPAPATRWRCREGHENPPYAVTCLGEKCRERRDER